MDAAFDVRTDSIAIGDPAMGLVHYALAVPAGRYRLEAGALRAGDDSDATAIRLDGPYLFVVDASAEEEFLRWFHRAFDECGYIIPRVVERLEEATAGLGVRVGFYWEEELVGEAREGTYRLDPAKVVKSA